MFICREHTKALTSSLLLVTAQNLIRGLQPVPYYPGPEHRPPLQIMTGDSLGESEGGERRDFLSYEIATTEDFGGSLEVIIIVEFRFNMSPCTDL